MPAYGAVGTQSPLTVPRGRVGEGDVVGNGPSHWGTSSQNNKVFEAFAGNWMTFSRLKGVIGKVVLWVGFQARVETGLQQV